jgi:hypothetical protein
MASPKDIELRIDRIMNAWQTLAPTKSFGGMTLTQFQSVAQPAQETRRRINELEDQRAQAIDQRDAADASVLAKLQLVVAGVLADPTEGADSTLYQAFGYTRKSERKSGLTHKNSKKLPPK